VRGRCWRERVAQISQERVDAVGGCCVSQKPETRKDKEDEPMSYDAPTLQARHLARAFGKGDEKREVLRDVSLDLHAAQLTVLTGPSGSGKTTLLAILSGIMKPDGGQVTTLGNDLWSLPEGKRDDFRLKHCGFLFQGYNLFPTLTARQQLEIVLLWVATSAREMRRRADEILDLVGMTAKAGYFPAELSGGEKQRVALGRALIKGSDFVFADEPTTGLDEQNAEDVIEVLRAVAHERGATIFVVSHDPRITPYADQQFHLEGRPS
jgi:putative ABC transport system ATP-binding protein